MIVQSPSRRALHLPQLGVLLLAAAVLGSCDPHRVRRPSTFRAADSLRANGRSREAAQLFAALGDSLASAGDSAGWWYAVLWRGDALMRLAKRDSARLLFDRAMTLAGSDSSRRGWTMHERSLLLHREGKFDEALDQSRQAFAIAERLGEYRLQWRALNAQGTVRSLQGRYREAFQLNERALALQRAHGGTEAEILSTFNELGIGYFHAGRYTDAVRVYESALASYRRTGNPEGQGRVLLNLANLRNASGESDEAMRLLLEAEPFEEQTGEVRGMAFIANALGESYRGKNDLARARGYFLRALELNRSGGLPYGECTNLDNLGRLDLAEGQFREAELHLQRAREVADRFRYGRQRAMIRAALARLAIAERDAPRALQWSDSTLALADSLDDPEVLYEALDVRGAALEAAKSAQASESYLRAIALLESWRGRLALGDLRMSIAGPRRSVYEGAIRTLLAQGKEEEAFAVADRARARLLLELMANRDHLATSGDPDLAPRERLRELYEGRRNAAESEQPRIDREIAVVISGIEARDAASSDQRLAAGITAGHPLTAASLRDVLRNEAPNDGRAHGLLEYFWGDSAVYGWWVADGVLHGRRLGSADSLAADVAFLRGAVEHADSLIDWRSAARRVYDALVAPLVPGALPPSAVVVADGRLAYLPMEVLIPSTDSLPIGASRRITYVPSAATLLALHARAPRREWTRAALIVGDPTMHLAAVAPGEREDSLAPLPYAEREAREIYQLFERDGAELLLGSTATPKRWLDQQPGRYRYLHFATHARVNERFPERTHLLLSGGSLDLPTIRSLRLHAELVTLSACETALGRWVGGEGVIGLPHAFLTAGARGTVVTLWRVTDREAAEFMRDFYAALHRGMPPAEALRATRMTRLATGAAHAHPSAWAPFIFVGTA